MKPEEDFIPNQQENPKSSKLPPFEEKPCEPTDFVWSFRGYQLRSSEFTTAMVHFFRAEVQRANVWRQRLDTTTNWAVISTGGALSIAFTHTGDHAVILLNILLLTIFLAIEGRRYRYYELWSYRVRLMETDFFASMLVPPFRPSPDWSEALSESLLQPSFPISTLEAIGRRLRRNYLYIYAIVGASWLVKIALFPQPALSLSELADRAAIGNLSGTGILVIILLFYISVFFLSIFTIRMQGAAGEVLPRYGADFDSVISKTPNVGRKKMAWFRPSRLRSQLLTLIISDNPQLVSEKIIKDMGRGVTAFDGKGMYTNKSHQVLLCALTVTEVPQLKSIVASFDPKAFVIVMPASEVLGYGFQPLEQKE